MSQKRRVFVVGVGMTKFEKPGSKDWDYPDMAKEACQRAIMDCGISYQDVQQVTIGYCYGDSTCGQRAVYQLGLTGVPMYNVNNNCATGSTALYMAKQFVEGGISDCVMAVGFEKMERGSLGAKFTDRTNPMDKHVELMCELRDLTPSPMAAQIFGNAGREHMEKYGTTAEQIAKIAMKNHRHSVNNPYSQFRDDYTLEQIMGSQMVYEPLTKLQCCPTSDGAGCCIVVSEDFVIKHRLEGQAVEILGMSMATDLPATFEGKSCIQIAGAGMTQRAAREAFAQAGIAPTDVGVCELHDCFAANELITYEALGLCPEGGAGAFIDRGDNTYGGRVVVNPSGGLISKGHPLGATGLAQCSELCWQLRGEAGKRQVPNLKYALQHNLGLGGAAVVGVYGRPAQWVGKPKTTNASGGQGPFPVPASATSMLSAAPVSAQLGSAAIFKVMGEELPGHPEVIKKVNGVFQYIVTVGGKEAGAWVVDLKNAPGSVKEGKAPKVDCTITMADSDMVDLFSGKGNGQQMFMQGKLKIKGNMSYAMKLQELQKLQPKSKL
eukprot:CAMPEP_0114554198 /NCGR_PEP_ID=MMETSP0114-20121206/8083_1 /TAXON_ID=31324 /ORGANISM="Goniomonas sp, Strain m" /LENGTH=549 /DNA_ID=CAMNT_0001739231 /DNA_START=17 /DNA_END=1666 /DNA_ORIENTATION=+